MEPGQLYVGSEPKTYADAWATANHQEACYQQFMTEHRNDLMLNAGLLGGSREDVMDYAHAIVRIWYRIESNRFWGKESCKPCVGDMIAFGMVGYQQRDKLVTGPRINTVFKTNGTGREYAWWQHK